MSDQNEKEIYDEILMAYSDGELSPEEEQRIKGKLIDYEELRERLAVFVDTRRFLTSEYLKVRSEGVPERFLKIIQSSASKHASSESGESSCLGIVTDGVADLARKGFYLPTDIIQKLTKHFGSGEAPMPSFRYSGFAPRGSDKRTDIVENIEDMTVEEIEVMTGLISKSHVVWFPTEFDTTNDGTNLIIALQKAGFDGDYAHLEQLPNVTIASNAKHRFTDIRVSSDAIGVVIHAKVKPRIPTETVSGLYVKTDANDSNLVQIRLSLSMKAN